MSTDKLLSQDEIGALLEAVSDGNMPERSPARRVPEEPVHAYDLTGSGKVLRSFLPTLGMVNERFARSYRLSLFNILRRYAELSPGGVQVLTLSEYMHTLRAPISINLTRVRPLRGTAMVVFEPQLLFSVVECFYGGNGRSMNLEKTEFTAAELRMAQILLDHAFDDLKQSWSSIMSLQFEHLNSETNPQFATVMGASESDVMVVSVFNVDLRGAGGAFHISLPYSMLEPLRARLTAPIQNVGLEPSERFKESLTKGLKDASVELASTLTTAAIPLEELLHLKEGDVIPVHLPGVVTLDVGGVPVYRGKYGIAHGKRAIKILSRAQTE